MLSPREPTVYYTLADVQNTHYVKHIVPVVYQQTIKNVTQHEYVTEQTLDQVFEEAQMGLENDVAGLVSAPCPAVTPKTMASPVGGGCGNIIVQSGCGCR
ncbi:MAG: hypothetical protein FWF59_02615 [Turicibacter sp.]|nr:hypothetical protein [Turicibacter sp.]